MIYQDFIHSLSNKEPNLNIMPELKALWFDKNGNWEEAHQIIQNETGKNPALIHAYLHRKEGDSWNANYWYRLASEELPNISINKEWENLAKKFTE